MAIIRPQWIGCYIGDNDWLFAINRGTARSRARPDLQPVSGLDVFLRETGGSPSSQSYTLGVHKKDGAQHSGIMLLDVSTQSFQYPGERSLAHDHRQYPVIERRQGQ